MMRKSPTLRRSSTLRGLILALSVHLFASAPLSAADFVRGDANIDGRSDVSDAVAILLALFVRDDPRLSACEDAADANDSGAVDIADALYVVHYLFSGGPIPPSPFPGCGDDPTPDGLGCSAHLPQCANASSRYDPPWADRTPSRTISFTYDPNASAAGNGRRLADRIQRLSPGDRLEIPSGRYSIDIWFNINLRGTTSAPIWIVAAPGATPVITRRDARQNCMNVGNSSTGPRAEYLCFRGLEFTGGDTIIKLYSASNIWIDQCHVHDGDGVCIAANSADTDHLYLTRNEIHDGGGSAEGMYLGANHSVSVMRDSVIALNHVYNCFGSQGDGIEIKQGSFGNLVAENLVHDCNYPCILAYGTDGNAPNIIERNVCYSSGDNVIQVQGEAIVRDNLAIAAGAYAFSSHDHQGQTVDLTVVHNTFVNARRCVNLSSWNGRSGMVFANNACYSRNAEALRFSGGSSRVTVRGNVVFGAVAGTSTGFTRGRGLDDFVDLSWNASRRDATPSTDSALVGAANGDFATEVDLRGTPRTAPHDAGCYEAP